MKSAAFIYAVAWLLVAFVAALALVMLATGCAAQSPTWDRARGLGCRKACARLADAAGHNAATGWALGPGECGCRFDDGTVDTTCERPSEGACS
jgi:hypothetical protein